MGDDNVLYQDTQRVYNELGKAGTTAWGKLLDRYEDFLLLRGIVAPMTTGRGPEQGRPDPRPALRGRIDHALGCGTGLAFCMALITASGVYVREVGISGWQAVAVVAVAVVVAVGGGLVLGVSLSILQDYIEYRIRLWFWGRRHRGS